MEQAENLELEILLALRSSKAVPTRKMHALFEKDHNVYRSAVNRLIVEKYIKVSVQAPAIPVFELSEKGDERIDELLLKQARKTESIKRRVRNFMEHIHRRTNEMASYISEGIGTFHL